MFENLENLASKNIFQVLNDLNDAISNAAEKIGIPGLVFLLLGLALSLAIGFFGYKQVKLLMMVGLGCIGYFVGAAHIASAQESITWLPDWSAYILGAVFAICFAGLAFFKFSYALFGFSTVAAYIMVLFYTSEQLIALGAAIVFAFLAVTLLRTVFILTSSALCGFLTVSFLSAIFPKASFLQLGAGKWGSMILSIAFFVVFAVVQFVLNRHSGEGIEEED